MNTKSSSPTTTPRLRVLRLLSEVRDELSERREARAHYNALRRDLASYTSLTEVDDLRAMIEHDRGAEAEMIRQILDGNLERRRPHTLAS